MHSNGKITATAAKALPKGGEVRLIVIVFPLLAIPA
jgi:hypothetical protein